MFDFFLSLNIVTIYRTMRSGKIKTFNAKEAFTGSYRLDATPGIVFSCAGRGAVIDGVAG